MIRCIYLLSIMSLSIACTRSEPMVVVDHDELTIRCGTLFDVLKGESLKDQIIVIRDERFDEILPSNDSMTVDMDLSEYTCLPGLIDMHVHLDTLPEDANDYTVFLRRSRDDTMNLAEKLSAVVINQGFTTVRHVGAYTAWLDRDIRQRIESGEVAGPRIRIAGPYLTIPHGGGDMYIPGVDDSEIPAYYREGVARGPDEFRARAQDVVAGGADLIKVIASGAVFGHGSVPGAPEMTFEEIFAVVEVANTAGIKVTAHAHSAESIKDAILAGVSSIEHASLGNDESVALAVQHDVAFSMDVYNGTYTEEVGDELGYAEEFMQKNEDTTEAQRVVFRKALAAGVTLVFGTDLGVLPHDMGARQFVEMVKQGMSPLHAIRAATSVAADHMGLSADVGAIEVGRYGDLIAVRGDPLEDIAVLQNVEVVIKGGEVVRNATAGD